MCTFSPTAHSPFNGRPMARYSPLVAAKAMRKPCKLFKRTPAAIARTWNTPSTIGDEHRPVPLREFPLCLIRSPPHPIRTVGYHNTHRCVYCQCRTVRVLTLYTALRMMAICQENKVAARIRWLLHWDGVAVAPLRPREPLKSVRKPHVRQSLPVGPKRELQEPLKDKTAQLSLCFRELIWPCNGRCTRAWQHSLEGLQCMD